MKKTTSANRKSTNDKNTRTQISNIRRRVVPVLKQHEIKRAALFGSFARGEQTTHSDLDLLVEFRRGKSLFDLVALKMDLETKTGRKVDLLTYRSLHRSIRDRILSEQVILL
jgi:predicted nucleotidyltransferase